MIEMIKLQQKQIACSISMIEGMFLIKTCLQNSTKHSSTDIVLFSITLKNSIITSALATMQSGNSVSTLKITTQ